MIQKSGQDGHSFYINCYLCIRIRADITFHHYRKDIGGNNENSRLSISFFKPGFIKFFN